MANPRRIQNILLMILCVSVLFGQDEQDRKIRASKFKEKYGTSWRMRWNEKENTPRSIYFGKTKENKIDDYERIAIKFLKDNKDIFKYDHINNYKISGKKLHGNKGNHVFIKQVVNDIPIYGRGINISITNNGEIYRIMCSYLPETPSAQENQSAFEDSLFIDIITMIKNKEYGSALTSLEQIIIDYEDSEYAYRALNLSLKLCRNHKVADKEAWLDKISKSVSNDDLAGLIDLKKVSNYHKKGKIDKAIALSEKALEKSNKKYEVTSLFNLFNFYHKDKENLELAMLYLEELKTQYPDHDLTYIARMDMNEEIIYDRLEKELLPEAQSEEEAIVLPETYALFPAYPNPFNPSTTLEYALPVKSEVKCSICDISGNLIREFNYDQSAGIHKIKWDGSNVSSGIYLVRFVAESSDGSESFVDYQKVTLLK